MTRTRERIAILGVLLLSACGDDGATSDAGGPREAGALDPAEEACARVGEPARPIDAAAERGGDAPAIAVDGAPHLVRLPAGAVGWVRIEVAAAMEIIVLLRAPDALEGVYRDDSRLAVDSAGPDPFCPGALREHFDVDLPAPGAYRIGLGPSATDEVLVIVDHAEGHGE